jgi:DNA-binding beta-propeller fold protein YncE
MRLAGFPRALRAPSVLCVTAALGGCAWHDSSTAGGPDETGRVASADTVIQECPSPRTVPRSDNPYTLFETLQVRPLAISHDRHLLFALNTPDNRLEIFDIERDGLAPVGSVRVGLEPVAVAVHGPNEVWVVNHLSDSVSVVDVERPERPRVKQTLLVGDEPRDIVFAGPHRDRAFITTAHRGQNSPDDPDLFAPVGRADVWVFDARHPDDAVAFGGERLAKVTLFSDTPRALSVSPDGKTVYAAAFMSGNQTTAVSEDAVAKVYGATMPGPGTIDFLGNTIPQPTTGLVVKWKPGPDGTFHWFDVYGTVFDSFVRVRLPDDDVFAIDAMADPPVETKVFAHVGTTLFNMAVNPRSGKVYVSNTDAHNDVRFEGHTPGFTSVVGNAVDSRITVVDPAAGTVVAHDLNTHLDHARAVGDASLSVAFPQDMAVSADGKSLYVVAQGSSKLVAYETKSLEAGTLVPSARAQVSLSGGGPTGVVLDERRHVAFVLTRFDDSISVVDLSSRKETAHVAMYSPEPSVVTAGRRFLYDAAGTSALGDQACASCHIGGDFDGLAWDLGNPGNFPLPITKTVAQESDLMTIPEQALIATLGPPIAGVFAGFQPLKGPMTTQSLRGLDNHGAMHWRGDRNGAIQQTGMPFLDATGSPVVTRQPGSGMFDELAAFESFNVAFPGLIGNPTQIADSDMEAFAKFVLEITYPPNPIRALDDALTPEQEAGREFYFNKHADGTEASSDRFHDCNGCHVLDPNGNRGATRHPGFFGTDGRLSFENETQIFKVPHLRNAYQKVGMYGTSIDPVHAVLSAIPALNPAVDAVRGFGYQHDGVTATVEHFLSGSVFARATIFQNRGGVVPLPPNADGIPLFNDPTDPFNPATGISTEGLAIRRALSSFVLAFDTNLRPIVGQQVTLTAKNAAAAASRIDLLESQAAAGSCDLVAHGVVHGLEMGFVLSSGLYVCDVATAPPLTGAALRGLVDDKEDALTFTCAPPGSGFRLGIDRDGDGFADGDERSAGSDPADPTSTPRSLVFFAR